MSRTVRLDAPQVPIQMTTRLVAFLGMVTAFDAMAIDIYLPAFPILAKYFAVEPARIQATLAIFLIGLAIGQAVFGPLLDRYGRRMPLLAGIALFTVGSALAASAQSLEMLLVARFIQALGGAAALIAPRAIVNDLCDTSASARIFSMLMQIVAVTPLLAPIIGSVILGQLGWRAIFWTLSGVGAFAFFTALVVLRETLPISGRASGAWTSTLAGYGRLLRHPGYVRDAVVGGMIMAALFAYISGSPFVFTDVYNVSPGSYSLLFGMGGLVMIAASQLNIWLLRRYSVRRIVRGALIGLFVVAVALVVAGTANVGLPVYCGILWAAIACMSLLFGNNVAEAMAHMPERAGSASALLGVIQYGFGALAGALSAALAPDPRLSVALVVAIAAAVALGVDLLWRRPHHVTAPAEI